jgi:thioester reductase-like protein
MMASLMLGRRTSRWPSGACPGDRRSGPLHPQPRLINVSGHLSPNRSWCRRPYDDGIGLDEYVDWLIGAGYAIARILDYDTWLHRFETTMRALPERQRQASALPLLRNYERRATPISGTIASTDRFRAAVQKAKSVRRKTSHT